MQEIRRPFYLNKLISYLGNGLIKVITGVRRCGKSHLLFHDFKEYLLSNGVAEDHIISLNLETLENVKYRDLYKFADYFRKNRKADGKTNYFLIDEIQMVRPKKIGDDSEEKATFHDALNEFLNYGDCEIYVTGSNSKMLSKDILTSFRGRATQIRIFPFSFIEYSSIYGVSQQSFIEYLNYGGLPGLSATNDQLKKREYLSDLIEETYIKDILERHKGVNEDSLKKVFKIVASNVGSFTNAEKLSNTFLSIEKKSISNNTIEGYLEYFKDSFLVNEAEKYDVAGKRHIGGNSKYYFVDSGLRNALLNFRDIEMHKLIEEAIYNDLLRRGYSVDVGNISVVKRIDGKFKRVDYEVDFVINNSDSKAYVQVAYSIDNNEKFIQETNSFSHIKDGFRRILISSNYGTPFMDEQGYLRVGLLEFLTMEDISSLL